MAPQLVQKRHFAADALPPDAVDKPLHVRWPDSRRPVQDEACGDEFACAVLALIAIGSPAAVAEEAMPGIEVRCALSAALSDSEQNQRSRARRRLCSLRSRDRGADVPRRVTIDYDSERPPTAARDAVPWLLRVRCPASGPIDRSYSASETP